MSSIDKTINDLDFITGSTVDSVNDSLPLFDVSEGRTRKISTGDLFGSVDDITINDTITINAQTWTIGNNFIATHTAGIAAAGGSNLHDFLTTFSGDAGGTSDVRVFRYSSTVSGTNDVNTATTQRSQLISTASGTVGTINTIEGVCQAQGTGVIAAGDCFHGFHVLNHASAAITDAAVYAASGPSVLVAGAITTLRGFHAANLGRASVATAVGLEIEDFTASTTMRGIQSSLLAGSGKHNLYIDGTAPNFISASLNIGSATADANVTTGLTINQGVADDVICAFKSSDVAHGMTDEIETDTYGAFSKIGGATGGLFVRGFSETGQVQGIMLQAASASASTTKSTSGGASVEIRGQLKNGTGVTGLGADANILSIRDNSTTRFIFDTEGSAHADVEWTTFDKYDDLALLNGLDAEMIRRKGVAIDKQFSEWVAGCRDILQSEGIFNFYDDGPRAMMNLTRMHMLEVGAIRQLGVQVNALTNRLRQLESK